MLKKLVATSLVSSSLVLGSLAPMASAQPLIQGGLINVYVNDVVDVEDVNVVVAAQVAATLCDVVDVGAVNVAILGQAVTALRTGAETVACETETGDIVTFQR
jgi:hypothetical protein